MAKKATKNPAKKIRDVTITQDRLSGMSYREIAAKHNISKMTVSRVLQKDEMKEIIDTGVQQMITLIPLAVAIEYQAMADYDKNPALALKAAENIKKTTGVMPSNQQSPTITNIYNQQNNYVTPDTMKLIRQILPGFKE